ncbi:NUDIX hydrolase [Nocardioides panacisoli]|uniref:NUDIX domain-containing protein n=1 Tax=Nocardioides panacisoli TaxID=627624 RepID=UPI001C6363F5|nr:NUDIX hydrolase [Nocardioides panacisoli]QYJ04614.1 NUDIX hydrolase [Nocardioides panacisoli]
MPETLLDTVEDGVARITWTDELTARGWQAAVDVVRREVANALVDHDRVEAKVAADDTDGQRIATWSGLRREGVQRGTHSNVVVYARLAGDTPVNEPGGFRALLNAFLPRKRAISQMLIRDTSAEPRVLLCELTYKADWDLPGGVVEVGESPHVAVAREVAEELALEIDTGALLLTDWLPPWSGWDDALCLVFDGGAHPPELVDRIVKQQREIASAAFCTLGEVEERAAPFTARRVRSALANLAGGGPSYTESGR